jgi:hypothetical protein
MPSSVLRTKGTTGAASFGPSEMSSRKHKMRFERIARNGDQTPAGQIVLAGEEKGPAQTKVRAGQVSRKPNFVSWRKRI